LRWRTCDGIKPEFGGDMVHHPLDPQNALRSTEPAVGCGALGVGFQAVRRDPCGGQQIGVVGMQHSAIRHRDRQVKRPTAAGELGEINACQFAVVVKAHVIADLEIMALARDHHIIIAVIAHLAGSPRQRTSYRTCDGQCVALAFLAAKPAAHAPDLATDRVHRHAKRLGHFVLNFCRVLG